MKKLFPLLVLFLLVFASCQSDSTKNKGELLSDKMEYAVEIGSPIQQNIDVKYLPAEKRKLLLDDLLNKAKNLELPVYYYLPDTLMPMEKEYIGYLFHHIDTEYVENQAGDLEPIIYEEKLDPDAISKLKFLEQWYYNKKTSEFFKEVIAVCPMIEKYKDANESLGFKGLFWIYLDPNKNKK